MSTQRFLQALNRILKLFHRTVVPFDPLASSRTFGMDDASISVTGEDVRTFDAAIEELLNAMPGVKDTLSRKTFVDILIPRIREKKLGNSSFVESESTALQQEIQNIPLEKFRVMRRIYGVLLPKDPIPVQIGAFSICTGQHLRTMLQKEPAFDLMWQPKDTEGVFIECSVEARDAEKALELADRLFYRFELVMRLRIGYRTTRFEVGILNYVGPQLRGGLILSESGRPVSQESSWKGALEPIPIGDPFFCDPPPAFSRLFRLISQTNNSLERHVVRCAEWTAQAMSDPNAASAFVKAATALEVLFSANEKGVITPSIMAQIAESCAFLLAGTPAEAQELERQVKRLYGVRSAVVHSGQDSVAKSDLNGLIHICRTIIGVLLSGKEFAGIDSMDKLADYFKLKKYSFLQAAIPNAKAD
jgi:hypothetical protein